MIWEYRIEPLKVSDDDFPTPGAKAQQKLNNIGFYGWELVSVEHGFAYLKRLKKVEEAAQLDVVERVGQNV